MTANSAQRARIRAIRARMATTGEPYSVAARALDTAAAGSSTATATIDPQFLVPYPDELVRPADADSTWRPVTTEELGWRALPANAGPAQRARAESAWRAVTADRPCRCSGKCLHYAPCNDGDDDPESCPGRLVHYDRLAASMLTLTGWYDIYGCNVCGAQYETEVDLPEVPWGEATPNGAHQFEGVRRINFYYSDDGDEYDNDDPADRYVDCPECGGSYDRRSGYGCAC